MNLNNSIEKSENINSVINLNQSIEKEGVEQNKPKIDLCIAHPSENLITSNSLEDEFKKFYKNINLNNTNFNPTNTYKNLRYDLNQGSLEIINENPSKENSKFTNPNHSKEIPAICNKPTKKELKHRHNELEDDNLNISRDDNLIKICLEKEFDKKEMDINIAESLEINNNLNSFNNYGGNADNVDKNVNISYINNSYNSNQLVSQDNKYLLNESKKNNLTSYRESFSLNEIEK